MGQRHQLFVIARVGSHYRGLAAVHHQWLYGVSALRACSRLLRIFSDPSNKLAIRHELDLAAASPLFREPPPSEPSDYRNAEDEPYSFPFIATCLTLGAGHEFEYNRSSIVHQQRPNLGFDQGDNNDDTTVLDITDLDQVRYCFVSLPQSEISVPICQPLTGGEYVAGYYSDSEPLLKNNVVLIKAFDNHPLVRTQALADAWPWGSWDTDSIPGHTDASTVDSKPPRALYDLASTKLFNNLLLSPDKDFDTAVLDQIRDLPGFQLSLRGYLHGHPEEVGSNPASVYLLQLAYAGESLADWHHFTGLDSKSIKDILSCIKTVTDIILMAPSGQSPADLVDAVLSAKHLKALQILDKPDRQDECLSNDIFEAMAESQQSVALGKLTLSGIYANGLRQQIWRPFKQTPTFISAFPVTQLLAAHEATTIPGSPGSPDLESFYLGDAPLPPLKAVTGLFQYLGQLINGSPSFGPRQTGVDVAYSMACGPSTLQDMDSLEISPLPAETYRIGKEAYHCSAYGGMSSKMRDLVPGAWTMVLCEQRSTSSDDQGRNESVQSSYQYAIISCRAAIHIDPKHIIQPSEIEVTDFQGFLSRTAPEVDTSNMDQLYQKLERAVKSGNAGWRSTSVPVDNRLPLSLMSTEKACDLLNQFVARVGEVEKAAQQARRMMGAGWIQEVGFDVSQKVEDTDD